MKLLCALLNGLDAFLETLWPLQTSPRPDIFPECNCPLADSGPDLIACQGLANCAFKIPAAPAPQSDDAADGPASREQSCAPEAGQPNDEWPPDDVSWIKFDTAMRHQDPDVIKRIVEGHTHE